MIKHVWNIILISPSQEKKIAEEGAAPCGKYDDVSLLGGQWRAGGSNSPEDLVRGAV